MLSDLESQAFCNQCGGQLTIIPADPTQGRYSVTYQCPRCGIGPAEDNPPAPKQNYRYNFAPKISE